MSARVSVLQRVIERISIPIPRLRILASWHNRIWADKAVKIRLDAVGEWFFELVEAKQTQDNSLLLYAAVSDLRWLVERFVELHPDSPLTERARAELKRIHRIVGD